MYPAPQPPLHDQRQRLDGITQRTAAWHRGMQSRALEPTVHAIQVTPPGRDVAEPKYAQRDRNLVAVLYPMRMARRNVHALSGAQIDVHRMLFQVPGIRCELATAVEIGAQPLRLENSGIEPVGNGEFLRPADLEEKVVLLVQVKGCRRTGRAHEDVGPRSRH